MFLLATRLLECLFLSSPSLLSALLFEGRVEEVGGGEGEESQEAGEVPEVREALEAGEALVVPGRVPLAAQALRNLLPRTVLEVVK